MKRIKSWVICSDQHVPWHDVKLHESFCDFLERFKPDGFVINGDFIDMYTISRHLTGVLSLEDDEHKVIKLANEFETANNVLDDYDAVLPEKCDKHFLDGNHCNRLERWLAKDLNGVLEGLISVEKNLTLKERGYKIHWGYPNSFMNIGKLTVTHGSWTPQYVAAKHLNEYRQSVLVGHAHTAQLFYAGGLGVKQAGFSIGCMCDVDSKGMAYAKKTSRWTHGFAICHEDTKTGLFWVELINAYDKKFVYNKKLYGK